MTIPEKLNTFAEFQQFWAENEDRVFEFVAGKIIEVLPWTTYNSALGMNISAAVHEFCRDNRVPYHTSGAHGTYRIGEHVLAPNFAYSQTAFTHEDPQAVPPLWAVEIIAPFDSAEDIRNKRGIYADAGILYWELYPKSKLIDVYIPGQPVRTFGIDDTLDAGDVLPGFTLPVKAIFIV